MKASARLGIRQCVSSIHPNRTYRFPVTNLACADEVVRANKPLVAHSLE